MLKKKNIAIGLMILLFVMVISVVSVAQINNVSADNQLISFTQPDLTNVDLSRSTERVEANGITLRLINAFQNGDDFQVNLCYTLPDERDWLLADRGNEVFLKVNEKYVYPVEEGTIDWILTTDGTKSERCEYLLFPVFIDKDATVKLTVTQLSVSQPEVLDCPAIQKKLDYVNSGIVIECYNGDGGSGINILAKPANMKELDVRDLVHKIVIDAQAGPWEFNIHPTP